MKHILEGLVGAIFGAILFMVIAFYSEGAVDRNLAYLLMAFCVVLGAVVGDRFLEWIRNAIQYIW